MLRLPTPSIAGEEVRFNNRDYVAFDDSGKLVWQHDHDKFVYMRDYADNDLSTLPGSPILNTQSGYLELGDVIIQWAMRDNNTTRETWTFPKPFTSTVLPAGISYEQRPNQTDTSTILTLYNLGSSSIQYRVWGRFELSGTGNPSIVAIAQQTGVVVPEFEQYPVPTPDDEMDWHGRHMVAVNDGSKEVWFINRRIKIS